MKFRIKPVPHIIIYDFNVFDPSTGVLMEQHFFLTRKGAKKFMDKHAKEFDGYNIGFGGSPLWFW